MLNLQDARTIRELFTRFDTFFRECSRGAFSLNLKELAILNSTSEIASYGFPCSRELCRQEGQLSATASRVMEALQAERASDTTVHSLFIPTNSDQLDCTWRGLSMRDSRQTFFRLREPWLVLHVGLIICPCGGYDRLLTGWVTGWLRLVPCGPGM